MRKKNQKVFRSRGEEGNGVFFYLDIDSWIGSVDDISHGSREANGAEGQHREGGDSIEPVEEGMHPLSCLLLLLHSALFCVGFLSFSSVLFS